MVNVKYDPDKGQLKMTGHANFAETGQDIICAACSAVYYNLRAVLSAYDKKKTFTKFSVREAGGNVCLTVIPNEESKTTIDHDIWYAMMGFRILQSNYPDYVKAEIVIG